MRRATVAILVVVPWFVRRACSACGLLRVATARRCVPIATWRVVIAALLVERGGDRSAVASSVFVVAAVAMVVMTNSMTTTKIG